MNGSEIAGLLPLVLIFAFIYFLMIRPARARQREALRLQQALAPGQQVMTTAGLYATLVAVEDDTVVLETSPGVTSRWARPAIAKVVDDVAHGTAEAGAAHPGIAESGNATQGHASTGHASTGRANPGRGPDGPSADAGKKL